MTYIEMTRLGDDAAHAMYLAARANPLLKAGNLSNNMRLLAMGAGIPFVALSSSEINKRFSEVYGANWQSRIRQREDVASNLVERESEEEAEEGEEAQNPELDEIRLIAEKVELLKLMMSCEQLGSEHISHRFYNSIDHLSREIAYMIERD